MPPEPAAHAPFALTVQGICADLSAAAAEHLLWRPFLLLLLSLFTRLGKLIASGQAAPLQPAAPPRAVRPRAKSAPSVRRLRQCRNSVRAAASARRVRTATPAHPGARLAPARFTRARHKLRRPPDTRSTGESASVSRRRLTPILLRYQNN